MAFWQPLLKKMARALICSDRDRILSPEKEFRAAIRVNRHLRDKQVPCLFIPNCNALHKLPVDQADNFSLFFVYHQIAVRAFVIAEERTVGEAHLAVSHPFAMTPGDVFRNTPAFLLGKAAHDGQQQFAFSVKSPDVFLLEKAFYAMLFQLPDGGQAVHSIPGKTADALGDDQIDFPGKGVYHHFVEPITVLCRDRADALIYVNAVFDTIEQAFPEA